MMTDSPAEKTDLPSEMIAKIGAVVLLITSLALSIEMWFLNHPGPDEVGVNIGLAILALCTMIACGASAAIVILGVIWTVMDRRSRRIG